MATHTLLIVLHVLWNFIFGLTITKGDDDYDRGHESILLPDSSSSNEAVKIPGVNHLLLVPLGERKIPEPIIPSIVSKTDWGDPRLLLRCT